MMAGVGTARRAFLSKLYGLGILVACAGVLVAHAAVGDADRNRILSIGGSVTEIIFALGEQDRLVARDTTSSFPLAAKDLPDVGYMRSLSPEGVLSVNPGLILAEEGSGPPETIAVLEAADIPFYFIPDNYSKAGIINKIRKVGEVLEVENRAETLIALVSADLDAAIQRSQDRPDAARKRVLFILSTKGGRILASGLNTAANGILEMAGARNAVTEFEGYKPLTDEAVSAVAPDVILMMARGDNHSASNDALFEMPAIATTPAAQTRSVVRMNGLYLLGFGPRTAAAITDLSTALYGP
tara:strand:- start:2514 stop:3410 length:897 start_codon:yes stop_codon:yes gene_type:complete